MKKTAIIFGGAGYIGKNMLAFFLKANAFSKYIICDLNQIQGYDNEPSVHYFKLDVRNPIQLEIGKVDVKGSWIFNFAAIHREPGHDYKEYFDTNIPGAKNVTEFARETGIQNIFFTSSIAPYGKSINVRTEESNLYPETAYGISKALAEKTHQQWLGEKRERRLIIVRPSVIYGPKDPGNVYRMIKALKKGTFILPNGGKVIKAYGYIYGLIESIIFTMNKSDSLIIYNYAENPLVPLNEMANIVKNEFNYSKPTLKLSVRTLSIVAFFINALFKTIGKKTDIHPVRVKKAGFPTNIKPNYLIENGFIFKYDFKSSLKHWKTVSPEDF
ncbi:MULTISPECIES: NAD(P)-dependent oxidoreductase [unclassified Arenibacter]|uniref:NAD-dependent epimerase/dehydratase family protein n=1 Tax=unclassified Arenibacter TaxID=2615047 RepID=UPI000E3493F2|nr:MULTISPECIES: NAD(P)-dependent oxidoreductase [unclassified Arenibacter]MCM4165939.1 NAD(P)-dependent oxidoreductase [Arenibacter sp. A80]RFT54446.1 NAD(P)-dependent oxidoreductase [Arenibacter sp. P308M17]